MGSAVKPEVAVIDYTVGNVLSVVNALNAIDVGCKVVNDANGLRDATHIILPGVGSFGAGMKGLRERGLVEPLLEQVLECGKPLLGICLGMQLMATVGYEHDEHEGLGLVPGRVVEMDVVGHGLRLPHIGWNDVDVVPGKTVTCGLDGVDQTPMFYFVHSFHFIPDDRGVVAGTCDYGNPVVAMIEKGNVFGVQFHPEKSAGDGLAVLRNFTRAGDDVC